MSRDILKLKAYRHHRQRKEAAEKTTTKEQKKNDSNAVVTENETDDKEDTMDSASASDFSEAEPPVLVVARTKKTANRMKEIKKGPNKRSSCSNDEELKCSKCKTTFNSIWTKNTHEQRALCMTTCPDCKTSIKKKYQRRHFNERGRCKKTFTAQLRAALPKSWQRVECPLGCPVTLIYGGLKRHLDDHCIKRNKHDIGYGTAVQRPGDFLSISIIKYNSGKIKKKL